MRSLSFYGHVNILLISETLQFRQVLQDFTYSLDYLQSFVMREEKGPP